MLICAAFVRFSAAAAAQSGVQGDSDGGFHGVPLGRSVAGRFQSDVGMVRPGTVAEPGIGDGWL